MSVVVVLICKEVFSVEFLLNVCHVAVALKFSIILDLRFQQLSILLLLPSPLLSHGLINLHHLAGIPVELILVNLVQLLLQLLHLLFLFHLLLQRLLCLPLRLSLQRLLLSLSFRLHLVVLTDHLLLLDRFKSVELLLRPSHLLCVQLLLPLQILIELSESLSVLLLVLQLLLSVLVEESLGFFGLLLLQ